MLTDNFSLFVVVFAYLWCIINVVKKSEVYLIKALLLIDIQNDYFPGGKAELENPDTALSNARKILEHFRAKGFPIIHVQHVNTRPGGKIMDGSAEKIV